MRIVAERGWTLTEVYADESVSAFRRNIKRPAFDRMMEDYRRGAFSAIVCYDLDRLTRQPRQLEDFIEAAEDGSLILVTANGEADLSNDNGRMFARIKASVARGEMERKAARQKMKNAQNVALGRPVPGRRRFGYEPGNMIERPEEAEAVRSMFTTLLNGGSIFGIAKEIGWTPRRVRETLTNPGYAGWVTRQGERFEAAPEVARIVDRDIFERVQAVLEAPGRKTTPGPTPRHDASGIAKCGTCGTRLVKQGAYYLCKGNLSHPTITAALLDEYLAVQALSYLTNQPKPAADAALGELVERLAAEQTRRGKLQELATWDGADVATLKGQIAAAGKTIQTLEEQIVNLRVSTSTDDAVRSLWQWLAEQLESMEAPDADYPFSYDWDRGVTWQLRNDGDTELSFDTDVWLTHWRALPLETRRDVLRNLDITVYNGRGTDRVAVRPR